MSEQAVEAAPVPAREQATWRSRITLVLTVVAGLSGALFYAFSHPDAWDRVDLDRVAPFALRSLVVYDGPSPSLADFIREYRATDQFFDLSGLRVMIEIDEAAKHQWVSVRGTNNVGNVIADLKYVKTHDTELDITLHRGFAESADEVMPWLVSKLSKQYVTDLTGHSLGGAVAAILMLKLEKRGYDIGHCVTFGQPKITDDTGADRYKFSPLVRFMDEEDPVAIVPPPTYTQGDYRHFGMAFVLEKADTFRCINAQHANISSSGWLVARAKETNVQGHSMARYRDKIAALAAIQKTKFNDGVIPVEKIIRMDTDGTHCPQVLVGERKTGQAGLRVIDTPPLEGSVPQKD